MLALCHAESATRRPSQADVADPVCWVQLAGRGVVADMFSLCFGGVEGDGALMLGDVDPTVYGISLAYTALVPSPDHPHYYCLQLQGVGVDGTVLPVPAVWPPSQHRACPNSYTPRWRSVCSSG